VFLLALLLLPSFAWWNDTFTLRQPILNSTFSGITWLGNSTDYYGMSLGIFDEPTFLYNNSGTFAVANETTEYCLFNSETQLRDCPNPPKDLIAYWTFDDAETTAFDLIRGNNGTKSGNPSETSGKILNSRLCDGTGDFYTVPNSAELQLVPYAHTISIWNNNFNAGADWAMLFSKNNADWHLFFDLKPIESLFYDNNVAASIGFAWDMPNDGTWVMFSAVHNTTHVTLYINGLPVITGLRELGTATSADVYLGSFNGAASQTGGLDDARLYNRSLSDAEILELYESSPHTFLGNEENKPDITFSFSFEPSIPDVFELVDFNSTSNQNITNWWWDFGDGSSIVSTTVNITTHTYSNGGTYLVNLTGLNGTFNNLTTSQSITIFEPTITIWAQDIVSEDFIQNFTVTASNSTNSFDFYANGSFAEWNYTDGPFGNVSIVIDKYSFNHTKEYIQINISSDVNFTASVIQAVFVFSPRDVDYKTVIVPVKAVMSNITNEIELESEFEIAYTNTTTEIDAGTQTTTSPKIPGQIWKIVASGTSDNSDLQLTNISFKIYNEAETESITIYYISDTGIGTFSETKYVYINKDGTYKILDPDQTEHSSGAFAYFPVSIESEIYIEALFTGTVTGTATISEPSSSLLFFQPDDALTGSVTTYFTQSTEGFFGFLENLYDTTKVAYKSITSSRFINETIYMLTTSRSQETKIITVDRSEGAISDTLVVFNILVNDVWQVFASGLTDGTGILKLNLDTDQTYLVTLSAEGFSPQAFTITEPETEYKFYLSDQFTFFETTLDNLAISLLPTSTSLYSNTSYWFNYTVVDGNTQTDYIKLTLEDQDRNLLFSQQDSGNPTGGFISTYYAVTNETQIFVNMTVRRFDENPVLLPRTYTVFNINITVISLSSILQDFQDANTANGWNILVLVLTIIFSVLHPLMAIMWLFILVVAGTLDLYIVVAALFAMIGGVVLRG